MLKVLNHLHEWNFIVTFVVGKIIYNKKNPTNFILIGFFSLHLYYTSIIQIIYNFKKCFSVIRMANLVTIDVKRIDRCIVISVHFFLIPTTNTLICNKRLAISL